MCGNLSILIVMLDDLMWVGPIGDISLTLQKLCSLEQLLVSHLDEIRVL